MTIKCDGLEEAMIVHIVHRVPEEAWDRDVTSVVAWCGRTARVLEDGETSPPDFDFVVEGDPNFLKNCTCLFCIESNNNDWKK